MNYSSLPKRACQTAFFFPKLKGNLPGRNLQQAASCHLSETQRCWCWLWPQHFYFPSDRPLRAGSWELLPWPGLLLMAPCAIRPTWHHTIITLLHITGPQATSWSWGAKMLFLDKVASQVWTWTNFMVASVVSHNRAQDALLAPAIAGQGETLRPLVRFLSDYFFLSYWKLSIQKKEGRVQARDRASLACWNVLLATTKYFLPGV